MILLFAALAVVLLAILTPDLFCFYSPRRGRNDIYNYPTQEQYRPYRETALGWIRRCVDAGAGEVVVNSIDTDGVRGGFDLPLLEQVCRTVQVPVIASGGAGCIGDFITLFSTLPGVDAGLAASIFHYGQVSIRDLKNEMAARGIPVRQTEE